MIGMHVTTYCSVCILILPLLFCVTDANLLYGCSYKLNICDSSEQCIDDGLFGQCRTSEALEPTNDIRSLMSEDDWDLITMEMAKLADSGYKWEDARTQCLVAYFMFTIKYDLAYDTTFCTDAVHPENLWAMLESIQHGDERLPQSTELEPTVIMSENELINGEHDLMNNHVRQMLNMPDSGPEVVVVPDDISAPDQVLARLVAKKSTATGCTDSDLSPQETRMLNDMMARVLDNIEPDFSDMSDCQIDKFIARLNTMKNINHNITIDGLINEANKIPNKRDPEYQYEKYGPVYMLDPELNKKDPEAFEYSDMGLNNVEHKIVKDESGALIRIIPRLHQIDGERVYVKLANRPNDIIDERLLIDYLQKAIGDPNNVTFTDFRVDGSTISFTAAHISRDVLSLPPAWQYIAIEAQQVADSGKHFEESRSIADEIFKRESDIASVSGARVSETGVGDSENHVPVRPWRDDLTMPAIAVVGVLLTLLMVVGGTFVYRHRAEARQVVKRLAADIESRPAKTYEDLCRQRMAKSADRASTSSYEARVSSPRGKQDRTQSSGSWSDEPITSTAMDITTGHMILAYMEEHLTNKDKLSEDWTAMVAYLPDRVGSQVARATGNVDKNRDMNVVPYDHNRVQLKGVYDDSTTDYINASPLADTQMTDYVISQSPLTGTLSEHWQMVWEQNIVVIVNLTKSSENVERYWPDSGNARYGIFEVHLVSEHIWCEDYVVRSFYLKNLRSAETRTITQFHYVNWSENGVPSSTKSLLDFRRKVNKSYRGKGNPILVHCSNGAGRSGTYALIDMVLSRIARGGVKQLDVAASLEHLRDQRMGLVASQAQYEFVLACIADETHAILTAMNAQH